MSPEIEELIEEIGGQLDLLAYFGRTDKCGEVAVRIITRIAQAIQDGEMKLPDEVGRFTSKMDKEIGDWVEDEFIDYPCIALRPLAQTNQDSAEKGGDV